MLFAGDEHPVGALGPYRADEALGDRRSSWVPGARLSSVAIPIEANTASNAAVNFASRSRIRWVNRHPASSSSPARLRASWVAHWPVGCGVIPSRCTRRVWCSMTNATYRRLSVSAQSTWKKSVARSVAAWARRKARQDPSCLDGGGMRWARRILRMVEAATRCPSRRSSPWILTTPHRRVLPRQAHDQRDELVRDRRAARRPGLAPLRRHQAPVPAQQRARRHDPPGAQRLGHDPGQRGEHGPVGPGHASVWGSSGAARPPRAAARVSPRPWTTRTGPAARARTARSPAAGKPARQTRVPIMSAS